MEFFRNSSIDFMSYRRIFVVLSAVMILVSVVVVFVKGHLNLGIDFVGGTQLTLKFSSKPMADNLRTLVAEAGIDDAQIQRFGAEEANEVLIKTPTIEGTEEGSRDRVIDALSRHFNGDQADQFDLNRRGQDALAELLMELDPERIASQDRETAAARYDQLAAAVIEVRREDGLLESWDEVASAEGVGPEVVEALRSRAQIGEFAVLGAENVGPQIGAELRRKGILAVISSLIGMLIYIWFRFELRFGIGALVALVHDVLIVLGLFALAQFEFNLTTVAAFLTLVGYSVNDTVVVFDRVRENLRRSRREPLVDVMNRSLNQTLSRTVLTSGTTLLAVGTLLFLGGDVLRGFAFIITIGVVVGTYSSIYVASPFALLWEQLFGREARSRRQTGR
jgi:preprotein translocase subunit SecF